ncbi:MAG: MFS transporter, partial [Nitriliruptor sp.]
MIAVFGVGECFVVNAVSYVAVVVAMLLIRPDQLHESARSVRAPRQVRDGFRYVWSDPTLRTTIVMLVLIGTLTFEFSTTLPML